MTQWWQRLARALPSALVAERRPQGFTAELAAGEHIVATADVAGQGPAVATSFGLWVPEHAGARRMRWDLISKASWSGEALVVTEAEEVPLEPAAVLLEDRPPVRVPLPRPGALPKVVRRRVDGSIRSTHYKELPGGGAWFVQRKVPGGDGVVLQVRPEPGTDRDIASRIAREAAAELTRAQP